MKKILPAEWAMAWEIKPPEIFPAWCYELTREHLIELRQRQAAVDRAIAAGKKVLCPDAKAARLNLDDPWSGRFKTPYLRLDKRQLALLNDFYEPELAKRVQAAFGPAIKAAREQARKGSDSDVAYAIALQQSMQSALNRIYETGPRGRGNFKSQLRRDLRVLGVYRLEKAGYRYNRLPPDPRAHLYSSEQRGIRPWNGPIC